MPQASSSTSLTVARASQQLAVHLLKLITESLTLREQARAGFVDFNLLTPAQLEQMGVVDLNAFNDFLDRMPDVNSTIIDRCYALRGTSS
jgi:hypothetical protein